jgi:hypothetical protein
VERRGEGSRLEREKKGDGGRRSNGREAEERKIEIGMAPVSAIFSRNGVRDRLAGQ